MYCITQEDFLQIKEEAFAPSPTENAYAVTFAVMEKMFPGYLYSRRNSFPCEEDLEDCLMTAEMRIIQRIRRYYFEREDMEKTPESLQRWMFAVLKNCHYTVLRQSEAGREVLRRIEQQVTAEMGLTYTGEGRLNPDGAEGDPHSEGGFDALYKKEEIQSMRQLLSQCFGEILNGRSEVQIILAWLTVGALMLCRDMKKKDAIAAVADADPTMSQLFGLLRQLLGQLPWVELTAEDWSALARRLDTVRQGDIPVGQMRFGDFTSQSPREYISKSINKRNGALSARHAAAGADFDF